MIIKSEKSKSEKSACPVFLTLSLIANKWAIAIIHALLLEENHTLRFTQLQKALHTITQSELTKQLKEFEKSGIVERKIYAQVPPKVEYTLTALGFSLMKPIAELSKWAEENGNTVQQNISKWNTSNLL